MSPVFERVAGGLGGPAGGVVWDGAAILFSAVRDSRILRFDPQSGETTEVRRFTNRINGLALGPNQRLFGAQEGSRRVVELHADGSASPLVALLDGRRQNFPTDLAVDRHGRIWLADPYNPLPSHGPQLFDPLPHASVLRLSRHPVTHDWVIARITHDTTAPRALLLSADETTLFVGDGEIGTPRGRELRAYPIDGDGEVGCYRLLHRFGSAAQPQRGVEGLCLDDAGNVIACAGAPGVGAGALIYVFTPGGRVLETYDFGAETPMRCAFGGAALDELYVTSASGGLWRLRGSGRRGVRRVFGG